MKKYVLCLFLKVCFLQSAFVFCMSDSCSSASACASSATPTLTPIPHFDEALKKATISHVSRRMLVALRDGKNDLSGVKFLAVVFNMLSSEVKSGNDFIEKITVLLSIKNKLTPSLSLERKIYLLAFFLRVFAKEFSEFINAAVLIIRRNNDRLYNLKFRSPENKPRIEKRNPYFGAWLLFNIVEQMKVFDRLHLLDSQNDQAVPMAKDMVSLGIISSVSDIEHTIHLVGFLVDGGMTREDIALFLAKYQININAKRRDVDVSPLMLAAFNGLDDIIIPLIFAGANIQDKDCSACNALIYSLCGLQVKTGFVLLHAGARLPLSEKNINIIEHVFVKSIKVSHSYALETVWLLMSAGLWNDGFGCYLGSIFGLLVNDLRFYFSPALASIVLQYCHPKIDLVHCPRLTCYSRFYLKKNRSRAKDPHFFIAKLQGLIGKNDHAKSLLHEIGLWVKAQKIALNRIDGQGNTALMIAAKKNLFRVIAVFLYAGADPYVMNNDRHSAIYELATGAGDEFERRRYFSQTLAMLLGPARRHDRAMYCSQLSQLFRATCDSAPQEKIVPDVVRRVAGESQWGDYLHLNYNLWSTLISKDITPKILAIVLGYLVYAGSGSK